MSSWAGTAAAPATPDSVYVPPGPSSVGVEQQVRHRLARMGARRARCRVVGEEQHAEVLVGERLR